MHIDYLQRIFIDNNRPNRQSTSNLNRISDNFIKICVFLLILIVSIFAGATQSSIVESTTNSNAASGSMWIEGANLHWADGSTEYWIPKGSKRLGEAGLYSGLNDANTYSVSFSESFSQEPLVFATTQTTNGNDDPSQAHTWGVDTSGFTTQHCEYESPDGCDNHAAETNGWVAFSQSAINERDGMAAGTVNIGDDDTASVSLSKNFDNTPIVFTQVQTKNGNQDSRTSRAGNIDTNGFDIKFCEQDNTDSCASSHSTEEIGWLAIDPSKASKESYFDWGTVTQADSNWNTVSFSQSYSSAPALIGTLQTFDGQPTHYLEANSVGTSSGDIRFCEYNLNGDCDSHGTRTVGWLSVAQGSITTQTGTSVNGPTGAFWLEGSELHWIDQNGLEQKYKGADTGNNPSGVSSGNAWIENGMLHYIDVSGNEREPTLRGCSEASGSSGVYSIDPDGPGGVSAFDVYCEMSEDGGGWIKLRMDNRKNQYWWTKKDSDITDGDGRDPGGSTYSGWDWTPFSHIDSNSDIGTYDFASYTGDTELDLTWHQWNDASNTYTRAQMDAIRGRVNTISSNTEAFSTSSDDDGCRNGEAILKLTEGGSGYQITHYTSSSGQYIRNFETVSEMNNYNDVKYLIPAVLEYENGGSCSGAADFVAFGYEKDYVLVKK